MTTQLFGFRKTRVGFPDLEMGPPLGKLPSWEEHCIALTKPRLNHQTSRLLTLPPEIRLQIASFAIERPSPEGAVEACCTDEYLKRLDKELYLVMTNTALFDVIQNYPEAISMKPVIFLTGSGSTKQVQSYGLADVPHSAGIREVEIDGQRGMLLQLYNVLVKYDQ
jgi:hypothetical protein